MLDTDVKEFIETNQRNTSEVVIHIQYGVEYNGYIYLIQLRDKSAYLHDQYKTFRVTEEKNDILILIRLINLTSS